MCAWLAWFSMHSCLCVCLNRAGGHHWQSPSPRICAWIQRAVVNEGSVSLFSTSEGPYRPPQAPTSQCVLARHSVPSHWDSLPVEHQGVGAFHTTDQSPSQKEEWEKVRGVCRRRKWYQDNGWTKHQSFQAGTWYQGKEQIGQSDAAVLCFNNFIVSFACGIKPQIYMNCNVVNCCCFRSPWILTWGRVRYIWNGLNANKTATLNVR